MEKAIELACKGAKWGGPFGAVIMLDGKIVGQGINYVKLRHDPTAHAEMIAIRDACKKMKTTSLKVRLCIVLVNHVQCAREPFNGRILKKCFMG